MGGNPVYPKLLLFRKLKKKRSVFKITEHHTKTYVVTNSIDS